MPEERTKREMLLYKQEKLKKHYRNIFEQNREVLLQGGRGDEYLLEPEKDTRMALTLVIRVKGECTKQIKAYQEVLQAIEPDLYYYPTEDLHITVLDILRGIPNRKLPENLDAYISCIEACAKKMQPFQIALQGTTVSDNVVLVNGYYEKGLEELRQLLRKELHQNNLVLEERYETFSAHVSVARIPQKLMKAEHFLQEAINDMEFGKMQVEMMELVFHNWYDSKKTILSQIELG